MLIEGISENFWNDLRRTSEVEGELSEGKEEKEDDDDEYRKMLAYVSNCKVKTQSSLNIEHPIAIR